VTIARVEVTNPIGPSVKSANRIAMNAFTAVFPSNNVQSSKFPFDLTGRIALAYFLSSTSPACAIISRPITSKDIRPRVSPENKADKTKSIAEERPVTQTGNVDGATYSQSALE